MCAYLQSNRPVPREGFVLVKDAALYYRQIGQGQPIIVIHGRPDFDHTYLLPDMDRLSDSYRLIYYDQRGRGRSRGELRLEEINIEQTIQDLMEGLFLVGRIHPTPAAQRASYTYASASWELRLDSRSVRSPYRRGDTRRPPSRVERLWTFCLHRIAGGSP